MTQGAFLRRTKMLATSSLALALFAATSLPAFAQDASGALQGLIDDHWAANLEENPVFATSVGERRYDALLGDNSLAGYDASVERARGFLARLEAIDAESLDEAGRLNHDLLRLRLENEIEALRFGGRYLAVSNRGGPHSFIAGLPDSLPFFTRADYESYVARLNAAPAYLKQAAERLAGGVETGWVQPCEPMTGFERSIRFHVVDSPSDSVLMKPFASRPATIAEREWRKLKADAEKAVARKVIPAFADFAAFYDETYRPACREAIGANALPDGTEYYAFRVRQFTTTDMSPDEIHALGLSEVARIRAEMQAVIRQSGFEGDFTAFQEYLRTDPKFYAKTPEELMAANSVVAKRIDGELPKLFGRLPRMPYTLKEIPLDRAEGTTTAYYERPAGDGTRAGVYRVNTSLLNTRPLFEVEALTLHEAVPGHHLQIALTQELTLPEFRKYGNVTAFIEGWGLYAERLGLDVGFYQDPYSNFGRLSYEMWRACRLVVDTGMHAKGWSSAQAIAYMKENTALSEHNIKAEVDRYIVGPGQALAYKIGELKFRELRERAANALGPKFDLRRFHDAVLAEGAVPLSVLEARIDAFIAAERGV